MFQTTESVVGSILAGLVLMPVFFLSTGLRTQWAAGGAVVFVAAAMLLAAAVAFADNMTAGFATDRFKPYFDAAAQPGLRFAWALGAELEGLGLDDIIELSRRLR